MFLNIRGLQPLLDTARIYQQLRTMTFIVNRRTPAPLTKPKNIPKLRRRHNVYETIQENCPYVPKEVKLILNKYVEDVGRPGDLVTLPERKARDLILAKYATYASPDNLEGTQVSKDEASFTTKFAGTTINMLKSTIISVCMNKDIPWTIEKFHVRSSFRKARFHVPDHAITMPKQPISGPDINLEGKDFLVNVTINGVDSTPVRCRIHHWVTEPTQRLPPVRLHWKMPGEFIFPEDAEIAQKELPELTPHVFTEKDDQRFKSPKIRKEVYPKYIKRLE